MDSLQEPSNNVTEALGEHRGVSKELDLCMSLVRALSYKKHFTIGLVFSGGYF